MTELGSSEVLKLDLFQESRVIGKEENEKRRWEKGKFVTRFRDSRPRK